MLTSHIIWEIDFAVGETEPIEPHTDSGAAVVAELPPSTPQPVPIRFLIEIAIHW